MTDATRRWTLQNFDLTSTDHGRVGHPHGHNKGLGDSSGALQHPLGPSWPSTATTCASSALPMASAEPLEQLWQREALLRHNAYILRQCWRVSCQGVWAKLTILAPHIGHLYCMVLADTFKRWQQVKGKEAFLCTGTDEHGMKIQNAAARADLDPMEFCSNNSDEFAMLADLAGVKYDFFVRTTDADHKKAVEEFWSQLRKNLPDALGLYKAKHEGWYCVSDECFYPNDKVRAAIVPQTGEKIMASTESDNEVEWVEEETWMFPLKKYKDALLKFYDENPNWITPANRMAEARNWIENSLEDLSITRPLSRLTWGIRAPDDPEQTIYVWVDALVNYLTKAGFAEKWTDPRQDTGIWPADLQVIGKDILRFHAVYWPALLLALGFPLPKRILCHNHWIMSGRKMSKSLGNVVDPVFAIQRWNTDPLRYFLMQNSSLKKDMAYSNDAILPSYEKHLRANLGNLLYRVSNCKSVLAWSTLEAVEAQKSKGVHENPFDPETAQSRRWYNLQHEIAQFSTRFENAMDELNPAFAVEDAFQLLLQVRP